jgi:F0F1-type ATP synthase assembly protein I
MGGKEPESEEQEAARNSGVAYAAGLSIFFSVATCLLPGWALDRWLGTSWIMIAGIVVGAVAGFYQFIRIISQLNK